VQENGNWIHLAQHRGKTALTNNVMKNNNSEQAVIF
jgi:hypothetical protein